MAGNMKAALMLSCLPLLTGNAKAGEGVEVKIVNDSTQDIVITVYDMNVSPGRVVLTNERINGFASMTISLVGDATGKAKLSWTANSTDAAFPKCGHADRVVSDTGSISVHADSSCSS